MRKTSVYLDDREVEALRRASVASGQSQAELIRLGVRKVISEVERQPRIFRSRARGHGGGEPYAPWRSADLYRKVTGKP